MTLNYHDTKVNRKGETNCDWIHRVLEGKQELNCVECVTEELLIIPPTGKPLSELVKLNPEKFHILVIPFDRTIRTIRDLRSCHIPMLERMRTKALEVINRYIISNDENLLNFEFHYTPSTYHLHLHVRLNLPDTKENLADRIHHLDTVIKNLQLDSDYYKKPILINVNKRLLEYSLKNELSVKKTLPRLECWKLFTNMSCYTTYN